LTMIVDIDGSAVVVGLTYLRIFRSSQAAHNVEISRARHWRQIFCQVENIGHPKFLLRGHLWIVPV